MGMIHGDGNTRQCMATAVAAYKESFGFDAPPFTYADFEESDVLVFIGANPCIAHPYHAAAGAATNASPRSSSLIHGPRRRPWPPLNIMPSNPKAISRCSTVSPIDHRDGGVDTSFVEQHTSSFDDFSASSQTSIRRASRRRQALACIGSFILRRPSSLAHRVSRSVDDGSESRTSSYRTAQAIINNLALINGEHWQARLRLFYHGPVQCHGLTPVFQHHESSWWERDFPQSSAS